MTIHADTMTNVCETDNFIVSVKNGTLLAYDKATGNLKHKYHLSSNVYNLSSYNNNITIVYKDYSIDILLANEIFKTTATNTKNNSKTTSSKNQKKSYGKFIIVEQGTTSAEFKKLKEFSNRKVYFENDYSGQLGTYTNVTIDGSFHTIIVKGDITGEGNINSRDISAMFDCLLGINSLDQTYKKAADMNGDGKISNADLVLIAKK